MKERLKKYFSRADLLDFLSSTDAAEFYIDEGGLNIVAKNDKDTFLEIGGDPEESEIYDERSIIEINMDNQVEEPCTIQ